MLEKYIITGGKRLSGSVSVGGAKNVAMKVILASLLTDEPITISNVPWISSVFGTLDIVKELGISVHEDRAKHTLTLNGSRLTSRQISFDTGGVYRTSSMVLGPLLARLGKAVVPNPGGCRIGKRPIDRHIDGLRALGAKISYKDGFFVSSAPTGLTGASYKFLSNTHTGTETLILAAVLAQGETVLENAAQEPEIDDLISLLNKMGADISRTQNRTIRIKGVKKLHGADFTIMSDRNEAVTFAIAALATQGDVLVKGAQQKHLVSFIEKIDRINGGYEVVSDSEIRFFTKQNLKATDIHTAVHPGFMTDWQAPWAILMTQCEGISTIHETVYEDRFGYVNELRKMGADIHFFAPEIKNPEKVYNFNWSDKKSGFHQAIKIKGPTKLHNALLEVTDLRAGATMVLAALVAPGESVVLGIDHIDRGYENLDGGLRKLGAKIERKRE